MEGRRAKKGKTTGWRWRRVNNRWTPNPVGTQRDIFGGISCPGQKAGGWSRRGTVDKTQRVINGLGLVAQRAERGGEMEGVVRVSSADTNDRRNRWETGNGGGEGGSREKTSTCSDRGPHERKRPKTNESPYPSLFLVPQLGLAADWWGNSYPSRPPPLLGGKVGQIGKVRFPRRTTLSCTHARRFVTSFLPTSFVFSFGKQRFSRVFFRALRSTAVL